MKKTVLLISLLIIAGLWGTDAYVVNSTSRTLSKIDLENGNVNNAFAVIGLYANRVVIDEDFAYVVNSGDNSIQKIDKNSGITVTNINVEDFSNPYDILIADGFAYVTGLFTAKVYKIDLTTNTVTDEIAVGNSPEGMAVFDDKLYVANTNYVYPNYNPGTVSVIDLNDFSLITTLDVELNPQAMTVADEKIHIVCTGNYIDIFGKICVVDPATDIVENTLDIGGSPANIVSSVNGRVYLGDGMGAGVFVYDSASYEIIHSPGSPFSEGGSSITTNAENIAVVDAEDWNSNSTVRFYDLNEELVSSYEVGIGAVSIALEEQEIYTEDLDLNSFDHKLKNFPNPVRDFTTISFDLTTEHTESTEIIIYNVKGQEVDILSCDYAQDTAKDYDQDFARNTSVVWDASDFASGIYFYKLNINGKTAASSKMVLIE
ncbi:MAG: T9SS type A sorting domain-containing protein [Candidatus Cloacimonetes bacterium]|nr:T9SS type A sorting domain-containing protein [Candidatus Cloacimonadota bacterium]